MFEVLVGLLTFILIAGSVILLFTVGIYMNSCPNCKITKLLRRIQQGMEWLIVFVALLSIFFLGGSMIRDIFDF